MSVVSLVGGYCAHRPYIPPVIGGAYRCIPRCTLRLLVAAAPRSYAVDNNSLKSVCSRMPICRHGAIGTPLVGLGNLVDNAP